jgi:hypothetical protein
MLLLSKTQIFGSIERVAQAADLPNLFEGAALVNVVNTSTGVGEVLRSTSGTTDAFVGIAQNLLRFPTTTGQVQSITVPASSPYTVTLNGLVTANTAIGVFNGTTLLTQGTPSAGTVYGIATVVVNGVSLTQLTFAAGDAGNTFQVTYKQILTYAQAAVLFGDQYVRLASDMTSTISVITHGLVFTDAFDPTSVWNTPLLKTTSGGIFAAQSSSLTGTNIVVTKAQVVSAPSAAFPYLGIMLQ